VELCRFPDESACASVARCPWTIPSCPAFSTCGPAAKAHERETFDMFGIRFTDHPDLTRILMPEDWEGHPYARTTPPATCRSSSRRRPNDHPSLVDLLKAKTSEGAQELLARERTGVKELRAEVGGVLRPPKV